MTNEMIQKAKECKSAEELLALAKENGMEMTAEQAAEKFAALNNVGELSDDELENAAGGSCANAVAMKTREAKIGDIVSVEDRYTGEQYACSNCYGIQYRVTEILDNGTRFKGTCATCGQKSRTFRVDDTLSQVLA